MISDKFSWRFLVLIIVGKSYILIIKLYVNMMCKKYGVVKNCFVICCSLVFIWVDRGFGIMR